MALDMSRRKISRITASILLFGFALAFAIFFTAGPDAPGAMDYDPWAQKKYLRELERIGGKANVLSTEIREWFDSLWHGRSLAYTVAVGTVVTAWAFWFIATLPPPEDPPATPADEGRRDPH